MARDGSGDATATRVVHGGRPPAGPGAPVNYPIDASSTFHADGPIGYAREGTQGTLALESVIGDLEGGHAVVHSSGMAAANAVLDTVPVGGTVIAPDPAYAGVAARLRVLEASGRIALRTVDPADSEAVVEALPGADLLWLESPVNPLIDIADLPLLIGRARERGVRTVCDNTFASPLLQQPLALGADLVIHSATKHLGGHSDLLLGVVVAADAEVAAALVESRTLLGSTPGALETFLALRGIRTLAVRVERAQRNAGILAERLAGHPAVTRVRYPGLADDPGHARATAQMTGYGTMVSIEVAGGAAAADSVCSSTRLWTNATSLGGVESLLERRRRWAMESPRVPESLIRLSVGIEDADDLWADLRAALDPLA